MIWRELRGESVYPVSKEGKDVHKSISKTKTFVPPTNNHEYLFAQLLRNLESACLKARDHKLSPRKIIPMLKKNNFENVAAEIKLNRPSSYPTEFSDLIREMFNALYREAALYRATGIILADLIPGNNVQYTLFDDPIKAENIREVYDAVDNLNGKHGKHTLHLGGSNFIEVLGKGKRGEPTSREQTRLLGETERKHLGLPILHVKT
jgi:DNA polymerase-4/DNA polymerase V